MANKKYQTEKEVTSSTTMRNRIIAGFLVVGIAALFIYGIQTDWKFTANTAGLDDDTTTPPVVNATAYSFNVTDAVLRITTTEVISTQLKLYGMSKTGLTEQQIADRTNQFAYYTLIATLAHGQSFTPVANYQYWVSAELTGYVNQSFVPKLGENFVEMMNLTADVEMLAFNSTLGTTINQTDSRTWTVSIQAVDSDGNASVLEGYMANYQFATDTNNYVCLRVQFNTTADIAYSNVDNALEIPNGNYTFYEFPITFYDSYQFDITFNTAIGSTYEVIGFSIGYGNAASFTAWDSQN